MPNVTLAKLSRPKLYSAIARVRLFQRLDEMREHPAIWVCGPPGAGKTTLLASYVGEREIPGIWYQVDSGDGDPATFFYYLRMAAERASRGKHRPLPLLTPEFQRDLDSFSRRYFRELFAQLPEHGLIVLDNVQEAPPASAFQSVLALLVEEIPESVNVVYISRTEPPSAFARYASTGQLETLEWAHLRLTLDETRQIAAAKHPIGEQALVGLFEQSEGWAAGLTLMLERIARTGHVPEAIEAETREAVFNYFAGTLFDKQPADVRHVLLRTAFLSHISPAIASKLTGIPQAGKLLENLHRRHLFTYRLPPRRSSERPLDAAEPIYEYHALFREFLLTRAREEYSQVGLHRLLQETAQLLEGTGQDEGAVALYRDARDWEGSARLVLRQAPSLLRQGRGQTLRDWIAALPRGEVESRPWISYWLGVSLIPVDQPEAINVLESAFDGFKAAADTMGQIACAARIIEAIYLAYVNSKPVEHWIEVLADLLKEGMQIPDRDVELRAHCSLLVATFACQPRHPRLRSSVERISQLLAEGLEPDQAVTAGDALLRYFAFAVDMRSARWVISQVEQAVEDKSVAPLAQLYWWTRVGMFYTREGSYAAANAALTRADQIAIGFEGHTASLFSNYIWVCLHLAQHSVEAARARADRLLQAASSTRNWDLLVSGTVQSLLASHSGAPERAIELTRSCAELNTRVAAFFMEMQGNVQLAVLLAQAGAMDELGRVVSGTRAAIADTYMQHIEVQLLLVQAFAELQRKERSRARTAAAHAVSLSVDTDFYFALRMMPDVLPSIFNFALREGIGVAKIKDWIERFKVPPGAGADVHWPWTVRVHLLGALRLVCRDRLVGFKRKAPQKPLELLVLIALAGPEGLTSHVIADRLWPDVEADAAMINVDTNVYRLRKLLGVDDALISAKGRVRLNALRCWVDVWSFERLAVQCVDASGETLIENAREALGLYHGHLLGSEGEQPWVVGARGKLAARMVQLTEAAGRALEEKGESDSAIELYQRTLALDNLAEPVYRRLIGCLKERGETAEALKVYRRCRELLSIVLGVQPSRETQALADTLRQ